MSISSVTPTLNGAPETLLRRSGPDARVGRLPVHEDQLVNPRQAVDGRPQTVQNSEASERTAVRRRPEEEEDAFPEPEEEDGSPEKEEEHARDEEQELLAAAGDVAKEEMIRQASMAPAEPSAQAARAAQEIMRGQTEPGAELRADSGERTSEQGLAGDVYGESSRPEADDHPQLFDFVV
ncbi:MAG: hypothetical protein V2A76_11580 [Planctomycetota bacterium]